MYTPKADDHSINSDSRDPKTQVVMVLLATLGAFFAAIAIIYFSFQLLLHNVPLEREQKWFSWFENVIDGEVIENAEMKAIFKKAGITDTIRVKIMCDQQMNAFAWPGGNIVLTSQLLENIDTEEGLAFVLGHEMGHIKNRDHLKGMARVFTFLIVDMFTGMSQWPGASVLFNILETSYGRDAELSADRASLEQMKSAFGHTQGGDEFFVAIKEEPQEKLHKALWFVSSHPLTDDRLRYFEEQNKDFLAEGATTQRRDLYDKVLCESGCATSSCSEKRSDGPKSQRPPRRHEPISLREPLAPRALLQTQRT